jgi:hypothetical protein
MDHRFTTSLSSFYEIYGVFQHRFRAMMIDKMWLSVHWIPLLLIWLNGDSGWWLGTRSQDFVFLRGFDRSSICCFCDWTLLPEDMHVSAAFLIMYYSLLIKAYIIIFVA